MSKWYFVPDDWEMSDSLLKWTKAKGLTDSDIEDQLESFRDHQYKRPMMRPDACWRNWVKNAIKWGNVTPVVQKTYRTYEHQETTEEERRKGEENLERLRQMQLKVVK